MALLAMGIEVVQHYFTTRELSVVDFAAGLAGIFIYLAMLKIIIKTYNPRKISGSRILAQALDSTVLQKNTRLTE